MREDFGVIENDTDARGLRRYRERHRCARTSALSRTIQMYEDFHGTMNVT
ncbi:zonadhesin [Plakobranchus ocellatus]|uniref:Zonadhesin n=1 Tax=Plakobranchus ocellatus TaxID=259542 RepID=A0AAV3YN30_9GAST|nr:zonadhesin [Plakobranchus ocellatus]